LYNQDEERAECPQSFCLNTWDGVIVEVKQAQKYESDVVRAACTFQNILSVPLQAGIFPSDDPPLASRTRLYCI
jgi:hypothetical protein